MIHWCSRLFPLLPPLPGLGSDAVFRMQKAKRLTSEGRRKGCLQSSTTDAHSHLTCCNVLLRPPHSRTATMLDHLVLGVDAYDSNG